MLVMPFADVQGLAPLSLQSISKAHYKCQVIIIIKAGFSVTLCGGVTTDNIGFDITIITMVICVG